MSIEALVACAGADLRRRFERARTAGAAYAVCIPARNEMAYVDRCLAAVMDEFGEDVHVVLVVNDTEDGTFEAARRAIETKDCGATLLDIAWRRPNGGAPAARALAFAVAQLAAPKAAIFSTDADTRVLPGLRRSVEDALARGFSLVCGRIGFIAAEAATLPPVDPERDAAIRAYRDASRHLRALLCPDIDNPWPHHGNIGGANFAMTAKAYRQAGPLPLVPFGEDRALRRLFEAHGLRIRYSDEARVETSCRLDSPTEGGLSAELARNRSEADPLVDEALEPPSRLLRRLRLRRDVEGRDDRPSVATRLVRAGIEAERANEIAALPLRSMGWYRAEVELAASAPARMRFSAMRRHLPALLRLERRVEAALSDRRLVRAG